MRINRTVNTACRSRTILQRVYTRKMYAYVCMCVFCAGICAERQTEWGGSVYIELIVKLFVNRLLCRVWAQGLGLLQEQTTNETRSPAATLNPTLNPKRPFLELYLLILFLLIGFKSGGF